MKATKKKPAPNLRAVPEPPPPPVPAPVANDSAAGPDAAVFDHTLLALGDAADQISDYVRQLRAHLLEVDNEVSSGLQSTPAQRSLAYAMRLIKHIESNLGYIDLEVLRNTGDCGVNGGAS